MHASDELKKTYYEKCPFPPPSIRNRRQEKRANYTTSLEQAVHGGNEIGSIAPGSEIEILDERRLTWNCQNNLVENSEEVHTKRRSDDGSGISICHRSQPDEGEDEDIVRRDFLPPTLACACHNEILIYIYMTRWKLFDTTNWVLATDKQIARESFLRPGRP